MEERPPIWSVAANILNKQSLTADKKLSSSLGVGRSATNFSTLKLSCYEIFTDKTSDLDWGDPVVDGRIIVRWIFRKLDVGLWTGSS